MPAHQQLDGGYEAAHGQTVPNHDHHHHHHHQQQHHLHHHRHQHQHQLTRGRRTPHVIARIKATTSLQALSAVLQVHAAQLSQVSLSAAIVHLVKLNQATPETPAARQLTRAILQDAWALLEGSGQVQLLQARQLSNIIWACSKLRYSANPELYRTCLDRFLLRLGDAAPQSVSNVLYAAAKQPLLQQWLKNDGGAVARMLDGFCSSLHEATPQAISNTLWAAASLRHVVPPHQLAMMLDAQQQQLCSSNALDVSNTMWAVASMGASMPPDQAQAYTARLDAELRLGSGATPQILSSTLWAVAAMSHALPLQQLRDWAAAFMAVLPRAKVHHMSSFLWAVGTMGHVLAPQDQNTLVTLLAQQMKHADRATLFQALDAVGRMQPAANNATLAAAAPLAPSGRGAQLLQRCWSMDTSSTSSANSWTSTACLDNGWTAAPASPASSSLTSPSWSSSLPSPSWSSSASAPSAPPAVAPPSGCLLPDLLGALVVVEPPVAALGRVGESLQACGLAAAPQQQLLLQRTPSIGWL